MDELRKRLTELRDELRSLVDLGNDISEEQATRADAIAVEIREVSKQIEAHERRAEIVFD